MVPQRREVKHLSSFKHNMILGHTLQIGKEFEVGLEIWIAGYPPCLFLGLFVDEKGKLVLLVLPFGLGVLELLHS